MKKRKALLVVNLGTPDKPRKKEVRKYLTEFLNDRRVIDIPWLFQKILVNLIIIPFRVGNSTKVYKKLWTENGSPLLIYLNSLADKLQEKLGNEYHVYRAMRYGKPELSKTLEQLNHDRMDELILFPLFPQYASSTTGSIVEKMLSRVRKWEAIPGIRIIEQYYNHPGFINAFANRISQYNPEKYDHVVFSYHGLPLRHIRKIHPGNSGIDCSCEKEMPASGSMCYKATCYETTRLLANKLNIPEDKYSVGFQSRLSKDWLYPFTDKLIEDLAKKGARRVLITAPSFVADCLETNVELGDEYRELFQEHGGEELTLVESLNDSDEWVDVITKIIRDST